MNPGSPPSPEQQEALRAQKEASMEAKINQHRADNPDVAVANFKEAAQSQSDIEQDSSNAADRSHHIERRLNDEERIAGRKLSDLNEQARMEIWGSGKATYTEPRRRPGEEKKRVVASPDNPEEGVLEGIRKNKDDFRNDAVFGKGGEARIKNAKAYEEGVQRLVEDEGLELVQAKLYMNLDIEANEQRASAERKAKTMQAKFEANGVDAKNAKEKAQRILKKELNGTEAEVNTDRRLEIIKDFGEKGVFTRKEYEKAKKDFIEQGGDVTKPIDSVPEGLDESVDAPEDGSEDVTEKIEDLVDEVIGDEPPESPQRRRLGDRFRDFCVRLAHEGGEKGDRTRRALRYAGIGLIAGGAVVGVNELIDGDNTTTLYEITGTDGSAGAGEGASDPAGGADTGLGPETSAPDSSGGEVSPITPEKFNVEYGNGFTHEIMDYAQAHGVKDLTPEQAFQIYEHLEDRHGSDLINILGDGEKSNTYLMSDGNYGIDAPGKAV